MRVLRFALLPAQSVPSKGKGSKMSVVFVFEHICNREGERHTDKGRKERATQSLSKLIRQGIRMGS